MDGYRDGYDECRNNLSESSSEGDNGNLKISVNVKEYDSRQSNVCLYKYGSDDSLDCTKIYEPSIITFETNAISEGETFKVCIDYDEVCQNGENGPEKEPEHLSFN
jgi:hypothetical protein